MRRFAPMAVMCAFALRLSADAWYLSFPLAGKSASTSDQINSVFDHTGSPYAKDGSIVTFTGETAATSCRNTPQQQCQHSSRQPFSVKGMYSYRDWKLGRLELAYGGHPGYDYVAPYGTNLYAPADGWLEVPTSDTIYSNPATFNTFRIDHGNGYSTWFLHASERINPGFVTRGQYIGKTGDRGVPGAPHLHFEVRRNDVPVDPYGWEGGCRTDPYTAAPNVNLWTNSGNEWSFSAAGNSQGWIASSADCWSVSGDRLWLNPNASAPRIDSPPLMNVSATQFNTVDLSMRTTATTGSGAAYFTTSDSPTFGEDKRVDFVLNPMGSHRVVMSGHPLWRGSITGLRIRPVAAGIAGTDTDSISFEHIRLVYTAAQPLPVITSNLTISPSGPYTIGQTLTARFTITNKGNASITFDTLTAGGRRDGQTTCSGACPDFAFSSNVTLAPGQAYSYSGTQLMTAAGTYGFFAAYRKADGTWNTSIAADPGIANTASIVIDTGTTQTACGDADAMRATITRQLRFLYNSRQHDYLPATSPIARLLAFRLQAYNELYFSALDLRGLANHALGMSTRALNRGDVASACELLGRAQRYIEAMNATEVAAIEVWMTRLNRAEDVLRFVKSASCLAAQMIVDFQTAGKGGVAVEALCFLLDVVIDTSMYGKDAALRQLEQRLMTEVLAKVLVRTIPLKALGGKTVNRYLSDGVEHHADTNRIYRLIAEAVKNPNIRTLFREALLQLGETAVNGRVEELTTEYLQILQELLNGALRRTGTVYALQDGEEFVETPEPPMILTTTPGRAAANVSPSVNTLTVQFDQTITAGSLSVTVTTGAGTAMPIANRTITDDTLTLTLGAALAGSEVYVVNLAAGAVRGTGSVPNDPAQWTFTTIPAAVQVWSNVTVANTGGYGLNLRSTAAISDSNVITRLPEGTRMQITSGPVQSDGHSWWRVTDGTQAGWSATGDWLVPSDKFGLRVRAAVTVANTSGAGLRLRSAPGLSGTILTTMAEGTAMRITAGPYFADSYLWWHVSGAAGSGYSAVAYWLQPDVAIAANALTIASVEPAAQQSADWGTSITYNVTVRDANGVLVPNATLSVQDELRGGGTYSAAASYTTTVPAGLANGTYTLRFIASKDGYANSAAVMRQVRVDHDCGYEINRTTESFGVDGGSGMFQITAGANCGWTAKSFEPWLTVNTTGATASAPLQFSVAANPASSPRQAIINVEGFGRMLTATIYQEGRPTAFPVIVLPSNSIAAGDALIGATVYQSMIIRNDGAAPLNVTDVSRTSGSTDFGTAVSMTTIEPGGTGAVTIKFTPSSAGAKSATFAIASNDPANNTIAFTATGNGTSQHTGGIDFVWSNDFTAPHPTPASPSATIGSNIYVFRAQTSNNSRYDPTIRTWTQIADLAANLYGAGAAAIDGKIYVTGNAFSAALHVYDTTANAWTSGANIPTIRDHLVMAAANGRVYAIGGRLGGGSETSIVEEYNPATNTWTRKADIPTARHSAVAAVVSNRIYVIGGATSGGIATSKVEVYNPATNTWATREETPTRRMTAAATVLNDKIYVIGGIDWSIGGAVARVEEFDPAKPDAPSPGMMNAWANRNPIAQRRHSAAAGVVNGKVYVIGGAADTTDLTTIEAGTLSAAPVINVPVRTIAFGDVNVNRIAEGAVTIQNLGNAALTLSMTRVSGPNDFVPFRNFTTLAANASGAFVFRFTPTSTGEKSATFRITSNDAATPPIDITMSGKGTTAPAAPGTWQISRTVPLSGTAPVSRMAVGGGRAYVTRYPNGAEKAALSVVDLVSGSVLPDIPLATASQFPGATANHVAVSPTRAFVPLANLGANGQLAVVDLETSAVTYTPAGADPAGVALPEGKIYVTSSANWTNGDPSIASIFNATTLQRTTTMALGRGTLHAVWHPGTNKVYAVNICHACPEGSTTHDAKSLMIIDPVADAVTHIIPLKNYPTQVAIAANRGYVCTRSTVEVVDLATNKVVASIPIPDWSYDIVATPDYVFVGHNTTDTISVISVATNSVVGTVAVGAPMGMAVDPYTNLVYAIDSRARAVVELRFAAPSFSVACDRQLIAVAQGGSAGAECTVTALDGFTDAVSVDCAGLPVGTDCSLSAAPQVRHHGIASTADAGLTIDVSPSAAAGAYGFRIVGSSGARSAYSELTLVVGSCSYSLAADGESFGAQLATGSAQLWATSGCAWSATRDAPWITLTSAASGTGNAVINYSLQANNGTSARSGTIRVAGLTFTITQAAAACSTIPIAAGSGVFAGAAHNFAAIPNATPGTAYTWTVLNGVLLSGQGGAQIEYEAGTSGDVTLLVSATVNGCTATGEQSVPIVPRAQGATMFYLVTPCRILDTRTTSAIANSTTRLIPVVGRCGVPATARAVVGNITAAAPPSTGWATLYAAGTTRPPTSTISFRTGRTRANNAIVPLSSAGEMSAFASVDSGTAAHFIIDITGYFQ